MFAFDNFSQKFVKTPKEGENEPKIVFLDSSIYVNQSRVSTFSMKQMSNACWNLIMLEPVTFCNLLWLNISND